jgi:DNA-directed RNA polymerase specialized sigma24 family protein
MESSNVRREKWSLSQESLDAFLAFLDPNREQAGQKYEKLRQKMMTVFRARGIYNPEDAVDEAIDRVIRRLGDTEVQNLMAFALGVARVVASEFHKRPTTVALDHVPELSISANPLGNENEQQTYRHQICLEKCLQKIKPEDRELVEEWYLYTGGQKIERKRQMAARRGVNLDTLRVQAFRTRRELQMLLQDSLKDFEGHA